MNILILSGHTDSYEAITNFTIPNKQEYANRYNYNLEFINFDHPHIGVSSNPYEFRNFVDHIKMNFVKNAILRKKYDWIVWIDGDAVIMNMTVQLESFIDDDYEYIIGEDWNGLNSGVYFIKSCDNSINFINACLTYNPTEFDKTQTPPWWWISEQCAYTRCLHLVKSKLVHHSLFNGYMIEPVWHNDWRHQNIGSYKFICRPFKQGNFILHLVASHIHDKLNILPQLDSLIIR